MTLCGNTLFALPGFYEHFKRMTIMQRLPLKQYADLLCETVRDYDFPPVTYDFAKDKEICHGSMRDVEKCIHDLLCSGDTRKVKDGLSKVLYWGWAQNPNRGKSWGKEFGKAELEDGLKGFVQLVQELKKRPKSSEALPGSELLLNIPKLNLPKFKHGISFVGKILMFLNPEHYPVLDTRIAKLNTTIAEAYTNSFCSPLHDLKLNKDGNSIPITGKNPAVYDTWACWCRQIAKVVNGSSESPCNHHFRAVDVERALFTLASLNKAYAIPTAHALLAGPEGWKFERCST